MEKPFQMKNHYEELTTKRQSKFTNRIGIFQNRMVILSFATTYSTYYCNSILDMAKQVGWGGSIGLADQTGRGLK